ncbi:holo-ACP synthase AcpS [Aeromicrobium wangtongii]|uniref:Holo-[acyl-carrier-protein] synthase n=1 Tax=Aeromicrobium wangtongii TaxID=2969247 RepID=A0ABY5M999_9ACTN|nr:holo-ACP synthase [Aeromicrobium wangtongii]MCD9197212.1 holo-ACP synthase [Aeromicrobium wangtongii]UUP14708.1 holo-ACP synthase [Aeromicrobium wangtongii]
MPVTVVGVGVDLVHVPSFADQLARPGTGFHTGFLPGERRDARSRPSDSARHLAVRWAAKEAVIKAWSASMFGEAPVMSEHVHHLIEVVSDAWDRPSIRLHGEVAKHLDGHDAQVSLSHDGDYAIAYVVLIRR